MLSFSKKDNHINFRLEEPTESFSYDLCREYRNKYFGTDNGISELLKLNILTSNRVIDKKVIIQTEEEQINTKVIDYRDLEKASKTNPLFLFSECFAENCGLNRISNGIFRTFMERKTFELIEKEYIKHRKIVYTSYLPGYFFQDIVLLTGLNGIKKDGCEVIVNLIGNTHDYLSVIQEQEKNPNADKNCINYDYEDTNQDRKAWVKMFTYRLIKFLEWFGSLGLNVSLNLYGNHTSFIDECITDPSLFSDITVGIDYVDEFVESVYEFKMLALCTTKDNGHIISLRTDGIPFMRELNYHFEIYINKSPCEHCAQYFKISLVIKKLLEQENENKIEVPMGGKMSFALDDNNKIEKNGKIFTQASSYLNSKGAFSVYETNEYKNIHSQLEKTEWDLYDWFDKRSKQCKYIYDIHGTNKFLFNIVWSSIRDKLLSIF